MCFLLIQKKTPEKKKILRYMHGGRPFIMYAPSGEGGGQSYCTLTLHIKCRKGRKGPNYIACTNAYVINGRSHGSFDGPFPLNSNYDETLTCNKNKLETCNKKTLHIALEGSSYEIAYKM